MPHSTQGWEGSDDLARQRRKREARLLDQRLVDSPELTLADVVADVLAAGESRLEMLDVRSYLATGGHHWRTIEAVVGYFDMRDATEVHPSRWLP